MLCRYGGDLIWLESGGGPLLLIPGQYLSAWGGCEPDDERHIVAKFRFDPQGPATDYDRACDVEGDLGLISIGNGQGLVLGDEAMATAWLPSSTSGSENEAAGGIFIRWEYANSEADVVSAVEHIPATIWEDAGLTMIVGHDPLYLLDSAYDASMLEDDDYLTIHIPAGVYSIATAVYKPDSHTSLILHRLTQIA